jgi:antitoxin CcdA
MRMANEFDEPVKPFRQPERIRARSGAKRAVNLSVDAEILAAAKAQGINLSAVLEKELRRLTEDERVKRFQEENREYFESYNAYIERNGVFGEEFQDWDEPV